MVYVILDCKKDKFHWFTTVESARAWAIKNFKMGLKLRREPGYYLMSIGFMSKVDNSKYKSVGDVCWDGKSPIITYSGWDDRNKANFVYHLNKKGQIIKRVRWYH